MICSLFRRFVLGGAAVALLGAALALAQSPSAAIGVRELIASDRPYVLVHHELFDRLGWDLPDGGSAVETLAEAAPDGAFDPRELEGIDAERLGYRAKWHQVRYRFYGLEWDITGLSLEPLQREAGLPTVAFINGGAANWYEFFLDPLNRPGLAQYLAQKIPVLLISIPGNYKHGGWQDPPDRRHPAFVLDRDLPDEEVRVRDAIFTFTLICEGVVRLIEQATTGPLLISGHSTGGEIQFLLKERLASRLRGMSLGWGTGGPASLRKEWQTATALEANRREGAQEMPDLTRRNFRTPREYGRGYVGPWNPVWAPTKVETAAEWLRREGRRRPNFKQPIQDLEHNGSSEFRAEMEKQIRSLVAASKLPIGADAVVADLFSTMKSPVEGYRRMIWTTTTNDDGHWDPDPARARELTIANDFRKRNPDAAIRVLVFDVPMTHYGHIERPRQLAGGLLEAVRWVAADGVGRSAAR
jgi:hypothetical protein